MHLDKDLKIKYNKSTTKISFCFDTTKARKGFGWNPKIL